MLDLFVIALAVCLFTVWLQSKPFFWKGKRISWKLPLPIVGNTGLIFVKAWPQFWRDFYKESGDHRVVGYHHFSNPAILLKDPELLKKVMITDADHFTERSFHQDKVDPLGRSLFFVGRQEWKQQRAKLTPYFTPARIKAMMPYLHPLTDTFLKVIVEKAKKGPIDTKNISLQYSTDAVMSIIFGLKPDAFENPNSFFFNLQKDLLHFDTGLRAATGMLSPGLYDFLGLTFFRPSTIKILTNFVVDMIEQRSKGVGVRPDFMQAMVELLNEVEADTVEPQLNKIDQFAKFDRKTVIGQCMMMYAAGTETTGNTLGFLLYELALHQVVQDTLRKEINAMLKTTNGDYGVEHIRQLHYLHQVISETLRKYPVIPEIGRKCTRKYNLDGLEIPVGTVVTIPVVAIHRDAKFYPDPEKFDPERFTEPSTVIPGTYLPFGSGPRTCIGMKLAQTEIALAVIKLLPKFKLDRCPQTPPTVIFDSTPSFTSKTPLWVKFVPIQQP